jgi:HEAT repeat protein
MRFRFRRTPREPPAWRISRVSSTHPSLQPLAPARKKLTKETISRVGRRGDKRGLLELLLNEDVLASAKLRSCVLFQLARLRDPELTMALVRVAKSDPDRGVRCTAFYGLRLLGDRSSVAFLTEALRHEDDSSILLHAVAALAKSRANEAVHPLIEALQHRRLSVRSSAARGLAEIGDRSAIAPIEAAIRSTWRPSHRLYLKQKLTELRY